MRLIDTDAIKIPKGFFEKVDNVPKFYDWLDDQPTIEVEPVKHGQWIPVTNGRGGFECSICHNYAPSYQDGVEWLSLYCPHCGAKMDAEEGEPHEQN